MSKNIKGKTIIVFDLETTGLDPVNDRIVSFAGSKVYVTEDGVFCEQDTRYKVFNPGVSIPKVVSDLIGLTDDDVKDLDPFSRYAAGILDWITKDIDGIGGHNTDGFDLQFLCMELLRSGKSPDPIYSISTFDTFQIEKGLYRFSLSSTYLRRTGKEMVSAHNAQSDVSATLEVLQSQSSELDISLMPLGEQSSSVLRGDNGVLCMNFGKHRGLPVCEVPLSYFRWLLSPSGSIDLGTLHLVCKELGADLTRTLISREIRF